ncbi:hypothetical protein BKA56DRAFT_673070 [Ilyonectria sp. MPI-CAGE-AT-0026]|nr:hypothetical protein BKA56DRAFT_673070 [Ilyonectria sp. MPI-CAGE-AT-0026]
MEDTDLIAYNSPTNESRSKRGPTEPPGNPGASDFDYLPRLEIRFSDISRTDRGIVFGANSNCDVILSDDDVFNYHFSLTFDEMNRPIVQDWGSLTGLEVTYDNQEHAMFTRVAKAIAFQIVVAYHNIASEAYIDKVNRFRQGTAKAEDLFGHLDVPRNTKSHTGAQTPGTHAIYLKQKLGESSFGVVTHYWDVTDGSEFAIRE